MANELFERWENTSTLKIDICRDSYEANLFEQTQVMARVSIQEFNI